MATKFETQLQNLLAGEIPEEVQDGESVEDALDNVNIVPVEFEQKESGLTIPENPDLMEDYIKARSNLYGLIGRTNYAIDMALKLATLSEHPRALEVAGALMKNSADITRDLLSIHKQLEKKTEKDKSEDKGATYIQQNNYYTSEEKQAKEALDIDKELDDL